MGNRPDYLLHHFIDFVTESRLEFTAVLQQIFHVQITSYRAISYELWSYQTRQSRIYIVKMQIIMT